MELVFIDAASIRERNRWVGTAPDGVNALIDSEDVVDVVVQVLRDPSKRGGTHLLTGPEALSWPDVATAMSANDMPTLLAALPDLEAAVKQISRTRTQTGGAINVLDQTTAARTVLEQDMAQAISRYVEVDTVTAASDLAKATQSLEVSRAVSSHIVAMLNAQIGR
jgi:uncharacterized protein YbjT (DUF2867 family)